MLARRLLVRWPQGREVLAVAPTGSGKTFAYTLPILHRLKAPDGSAGLRALVVVPTRELAHQIYREFKRMCGGRKFRLCVLTKAAAASATSSGPSSYKFGTLAAASRLVAPRNPNPTACGTSRWPAMQRDPSF